jgi:DNA-binding CsgD family transcriptional regulator
VRLARDAGALTVLPIALTYQAGVEVHAGELRAASALIDEADGITHATGGAPFLYSAFALAAWRGQEGPALELIAAGVESAVARGEGRAITMAEYSKAVLYNGLCRYPEALAAARRACEFDALGLVGWALIDVVEAGVRSNEVAAATAALDELSARTRVAGTDWALGIEARSRALLSDGPAAEALYREATDLLGRTHVTVHLARTQLVYGEWLRRQGRRGAAREQLHRAHDAFSRMGAEAFAARTRRELLATGEKVRSRAIEDPDRLTSQEAQIARLAREGRTNPEIGAQLFLSPRTVEWHLGKVFTKLNISSRRELRRVPSLTGVPEHT